MNKIASLLGLILLSSGAYAQGSAAKTVDKAPTAPVEAAAPVNPFTGKPQQFEQIQRELEASRLKTQLLEETLKQTNLREETATVPLRKAVEAAQARVSVKKEELNAATVDEAQQSQRAMRTKQTLKQRTAQDAQLRAEIEAQVRVDMAKQLAQSSAPLPRSRPTLLSVLDSAGTRTVLLDFEGTTLTAADGEMTPAGEVRVQDSTTAYVGGVLYKVHAATLSRFVVSDFKAPTAVKSAAVSKSPEIEGQSTMLAKAPALQLPPGLPPLPANMTK